MTDNTPSASSISPSNVRDSNQDSSANQNSNGSSTGKVAVSQWSKPLFPSLKPPSSVAPSTSTSDSNEQPNSKSEKSQNQNERNTGRQKQQKDNSKTRKNPTDNKKDQNRNRPANPKSDKQNGTNARKNGSSKPPSSNKNQNVVAPTKPATTKPPTSTATPPPAPKPSIGPAPANAWKGVNVSILAPTNLTTTNNNSTKPTPTLTPTSATPSTDATTNIQSSSSPSNTDNATPKADSKSAAEPTAPITKEEPKKTEIQKPTPPTTTNTTLSPTNEPSKKENDQQSEASSSTTEASSSITNSKTTSEAPSTSESSNGPKSWATLFANVKSNEPSYGTLSNKKEEDVQDGANVILSLTDALREFSLNGEPADSELRGLVNKKNKCFLNAVLQVLINCPPFFSLMQCINKAKLSDDATILKKFAKLFKEFSATPPSSSPSSSIPVTIKPLQFGRELEPTYIYPMLNLFNPNHKTAHIYQEDAQEFLTFVLDRLHEELATGIKRSRGKQQQQPVKSVKEEKKIEEEVQEPSLVDDEWQEVGKGNKSSIVLTKDTDYDESPITQIFGGKLRSLVRKNNMKASASIQPFYCIHLDIEHPAVQKLEDALSWFASPESLEGYTDYKTNTQVAASKYSTIDKLPAILIFHLKRFSFVENTQKSHKKIQFPSTLTLHPSLLTNRTEAHQRKFKLSAVISHHGENSSNGHYTCDIRHHRSGQWLHFDDEAIHKVSVDQVLEREGYLLFYENSDLVTSIANNQSSSSNNNKNTNAKKGKK